MQTLQNISTKDEILHSLAKSFEEVALSVETIDDRHFFQQYNGKWSVGENVDHLIRSTKGISSALKMDKLILQNTFGIAEKPSRTFEEVFNVYKAALSGGTAVASGMFLPDADKQMDKHTSLSNWKMIGEKFNSRLVNWTEEELDTHQLLHPVLGKLTMREMMFFTIFHNRHHLKAIEVVKAGLVK